MTRALTEIFVVNIIFGPAGILLWLALDAALALGVVLGVVMIMRRGGGGSRRLRRTLAGALALLTIPLGVLSAVPTPTEAEPRRIELHDRQSNRVGYVIVDERAGRLDLCDRLSNRTGYGRIAPDGRVDLYGLDGKGDLRSIARIGQDQSHRGAGRSSPVPAVAAGCASSPPSRTRSPCARSSPTSAPRALPSLPPRPHPPPSRSARPATRPRPPRSPVPHSGPTAAP